MYKKAWCTCKLVVLLNKPIAFLTFSLPSPSSLLKLPNAVMHGRTKTWKFPVTHYYFTEELSYVLTKTFVAFVPVRLYFFTAAHFHLAGRCLLVATTSCKSTWDTVPYFGINGLSMILCLCSPLHPLSKLLAIQDYAKNLEEQLWMGGRREVSVISHRPVTSSEFKQERPFFHGCLNIFATGCLSSSYLRSRGSRLLNRVKHGTLLAPKEVVIKNSISFS